MQVILTHARETILSKSPFQKFSSGLVAPFRELTSLHLVLHLTLAASSLKDYPFPSLEGDNMRRVSKGRLVASLTQDKLKETCWKSRENVSESHHASPPARVYRACVSLFGIPNSMPSRKFTTGALTVRLYAST